MRGGKGGCHPPSSQVLGTVTGPVIPLTNVRPAGSAAPLIPAPTAPAAPTPQAPAPAAEAPDCAAAADLSAHGLSLG